MSMRFLKWLIVALIAAGIALALERALRSEASAATPWPTAGAGIVSRAEVTNSRTSEKPPEPGRRRDFSSL